MHQRRILKLHAQNVHGRNELQKIETDIKAKLSQSKHLNHVKKADQLGNKAIC